MPIVRCPQCNSQMMVENRDAGHEVECPVCMAAFMHHILAAPTAGTRKPGLRIGGSAPAQRGPAAASKAGRAGRLNTRRWGDDAARTRV